MPAPVLQFKRGIFSNLPGLRAGEPGFTTDSYELYVGVNSTTQENKFFGSHRYWTRETTTTGSGVNLVEGSNNGSEYITLASPGTVGAAVTYYFPAANGNASSVLTNNGSGILSWASGSANPVFTGIATFSDTTNNTLGNENTGAVQIDGGVGIAKNLTVKENLHVGGYAEFVGVVTFKGGTINIGDNNTDDINVGGEFISGLVPNIDNTHDLGITTQRWKTLNVVNVDTTNLTGTAGTITNLTSTNVNVSGVSTFVGNAIFQSDINLGDNDKIIFGNSGDLQILHDGTDSRIVNGTGDLILKNEVGKSIIFQDGVSEVLAQFTSNGSVKLYHNNSEKFETTGYGATVFGTLESQQLNVTGVSTFTGAIDANGGADISGGETTLSSATVSDLTAGRVVLAGTSGALQDSANLTFSGAGLIVGAGGANITGVSTFSTDLVVGGDIRVNGNDIQASDGATNITLTSSTLTTFAGDIKVTGNDIQSSSATAITLSGADVTVVGDLKVTGNDIQSSTGATVLSLSGNDGTFADDLTVQGNLYVNGSTTQVNTAALTVEDRTIDLGIVNGAAPSGATTWDLGILFNYYATTAKKSAVIWEHVDARFKFASVLAADTDGNDTSTPQLTVTTFAPIEIASLFVNDCAGASQVISCTGNERFLENITVDCGTF